MIKDQPVKEKNLTLKIIHFLFLIAFSLFAFSNKSIAFIWS